MATRFATGAVGWWSANRFKMLLQSMARKGMAPTLCLQGSLTSCRPGTSGPTLTQVQHPSKEDRTWP